MSALGGAVLRGGWSALATLLQPAVRFNLRRRTVRGKEIAGRLNERFGIDPTPRPPGRLVWVHAASVGEAVSVLPVLQILQARATVLLTTGTVTSQQLLDERIPALGLETAVLHRFAPLDVPAWVRRFLSHWQPDLACFVESELWPNQLAACRRGGIPTMLLNARMSERSFERWRRCRGLARGLLAGFARIYARGERDAERLRTLGARGVEVLGDLKFAAPPLPADPATLRDLRVALGDRPVWLAASTHPGEEPLIADAHRRIARRWPALLTIIVPRHPDRGPTLAEELGAPLRSRGEVPGGGDGIWIADTLGEMGVWCRLAPIVFVGRSLIPPGGGQNPLEPARLGCVMAVGPHTGNFAEHVALLRRTGALAVVGDGAGLAAFVTGWLGDPDRRRRAGGRAMAALRGGEDLPRRAAEAVLSLLRAG